MKKVCILMGSPRKNGNTAALLAPFENRMKELGFVCETIWLYEKEIHGCTACRSCQKDWTAVNCCQKDDMQAVFAAVAECDLILLATPIYSWYCTPPMKAALDRMVYGFNKYYGEKAGPSLWAGKSMAILTTCGYRPEKGADLFEEGIKRYCKHSGLTYFGMLAERHLGYHTVFMDEAKERHAIAFAEQLAAEYKKKAEEDT